MGAHIEPGSGDETLVLQYTMDVPAGSSPCDTVTEVPCRSDRSNRTGSNVDCADNSRRLRGQLQFVGDCPRDGRPRKVDRCATHCGTIGRREWSGGRRR